MLVELFHHCQKAVAAGGRQMFGKAYFVDKAQVGGQYLVGSMSRQHLYEGIPTTNIIESINSETQSFNPTWHTLDDTMANIDRA